MTEDEARQWISGRFGVSRETRLAQFAAILVEESERQNLIAASTVPHLWARHLLDSAQLILCAAEAGSDSWIDVGAGAGLPGMVVAVLTDRRVVLVEPRSKRVEFLRETASALGLEAQVAVIHSKIETYRPTAPASVVSARAVAELSKLFSSTIHCTDLSTVWILPKGRNVHSEVDDARRKWQGVFHVERSLTADDSGIVVARGVRPR
jgi:16S rRNA (guanine527-N7)-methyltransferase